MPNYYDVLEVPKTAEVREIRQAYRRMARQYHPDVNPGDRSAEDKFKLINEAHSVLSDPEKRRKYDRYGDRWEEADQIEEAESRARTHRANFYRPTVAEEHTFGGLGAEAGDVFQTIFRNFGANANQSRTAEYPVDVSLHEAYQGTTRLMDLSDGRRLEVKIPPGVDNGSKVHVPAGQGNQGNQGSQGSFYLTVSVEPHAVFERQGRNLLRDFEIPVEDAVLGTEITVPTLFSRVALTIPPETQNGRRFRLAGQGMPTLGQPNSRGDMFVTVKVRLPTNLSEEQRDLYRQLKDLQGTSRW
jgi:DnaJ-class molecular chaperone